MGQASGNWGRCSFWPHPHVPGANQPIRATSTDNHWLPLKLAKDFNACTIIQPEETHEALNVPVFQNCAGLFSVK
ncbi:hypothetical protein CapIbe_009566 [Capra ibex]